MTDEVKIIVDALRLCAGSEAGKCRKCPFDCGSSACIPMLQGECAETIERLATMLDIEIAHNQCLRDELKRMQAQRKEGARD